MIVVLYYPDSTSHCAIALTGLGEQNFYLSFFPNDNRGFCLHTMRADFVHPATRVVNIPTEESCGYGLSEAGILAWYQNGLSEKNFSFLTQNCASVVYEILKEGQLRSTTLGQQLLVQKNWRLALPKKILNYAENLSEEILKHYRQHHDSWLLNKLEEIETLFADFHQQTITMPAFIYSYFIQAVMINEFDTNHPQEQTFIQGINDYFINLLVERNYSPELIDQFKQAFAEKNIERLLQLDAQLIAVNVVGKEKEKSPVLKEKNIFRLLFFRNESVELSNYRQILEKKIDDEKNIHTDYFKYNTSLTVVRSNYRR